jgi:hypothetical protein
MYIYRFAEVLEKLDEEDSKAIGEFLLQDHGELLGDAARRLRTYGGMKVETVLPAVLEQMWTDGLKSVVEQRLSELTRIGLDPLPAPPETSSKKVLTEQ